MADANRVRTANELERKYLSSLVGVQKAVENQEKALLKTNTTLEDFVVSTGESIDKLQEQIDGEVTTWFYDGEPTLTNLPASEWTTDEDKAKHIGDLYYDKETGYGYRFYQDSDTLVYGWLELKDSAATEALAIAQKAQDTADAKRRVFVVTPYTPYDVGDIWITSTKELYRCQSSREEGNFDSNDWTVATKYIDANQAQIIVNTYDEQVRNTYTTKTDFKKTKDSLTLTAAQYATAINETNKLFTEEPSVPYHKKDVYVDADSNIWTCIQDREEGVFSISDWQIGLDTTEIVQSSKIKQDISNIDLSVKSKVGADEIISAINLSPEIIQIDSNKINLRGKTINMTSDEININSTNFKVDEAGNVEANSIDVNGGTIAKFTINDNELNYPIKPKYDYTNTDATRVKNIIMGSITPTTSDYQKYDLNHDGKITTQDYITINGYIRLGISHSKPGYFKIETASEESNINENKIGFYDGKDNLITGFSFDEMKIGGIDIAVNNVLLTTGAYMSADQTYTFNDKVSNQAHGIVLVWSGYNDGQVQDYQWHTDFIPKEWVSMYSGNGVSCIMSGSKLTPLCSKYVYITDTTIRGHADNTFSGTNGNGLVLRNNQYVLRYVIGV